MQRSVRWVWPVVGLLVLGFFASHVVRADDSATTQPAAAGSITVSVVDGDGKPVKNAKLNLYSRKNVSEGDQGAESKPKALAKSKTDREGKHTFENLSTGDYRITATSKKTGSKGSARVSLTDASQTAEVTITLASPADDNNGATTAPSAQ
jgi:hypothetical protein